MNHSGEVLEIAGQLEALLDVLAANVAAIAAILQPSEEAPP